MSVPASLLNQLKEFKDQAQDWEELPTPINGVFVVRPKAKKGESTSLMLQIRPTNVDGSPMGRSKIFLRSKESLDRLQEVFTQEKLLTIMEAIEQLNSNGKSPENGNNRKLTW